MLGLTRARGFGPALRLQGQASSPSAQSGGFLFAFGRGGKLRILPFRLLLRRHWRDPPDKSGGPPLFELSLNV